MKGDNRFWTLFGGVWLICGVLSLASVLGVFLFADPSQMDPDVSLWPIVPFSLGATVIGWHIMSRGYATGARHRRLMNTGIDLAARVTGVRRSAIRINGRWRWHVSYRYEYPPRFPQDGESQALPGPAVQNIQPGDAVRIKVDPARPEDSLFLGPG